jgi:capsular exopolysaccharide synthesis family protein
MDPLEQHLLLHEPTPAPAAASAVWLKVRTGLYRYLLVLKRLWWVAFLTTAIGLGVAAWFANQLPPSFQSNARMMVSGKINLQDGVVYSEDVSNFFGTQAELMQSGEVQRKALERVQALHPELQPARVALSVGQQPKTSLFLLSAISSEGPFARAFLDAVMEEYIAVKQNMRSAKSESTFRALSAELKSIELDLRDAREKMLKFQAENSLGYLKEEGNSAAAFLARISRQYDDLKVEYQLLESLSLDQALDRDPGASSAAPTMQEKALANFGPMTEYLKAKQQLQLLQTERDQLGQELRPKHPDMIHMEQEIAKTVRMIEAYRKQSIEQIQSRREAIRLQMETLQKTADDSKEKATDTSRKLAEYERLKGNVESLQGVADRLSANLRNVDVNKAVEQDMISILEHASEPRSIRPGLVKLLATGVGAGLLIGLAILFLIERIDDRLSTLVDVQAHFHERVLGQIGHEEGDAVPLLQFNDRRHAFAEGFRSLRSSLVFMPNERAKPKVILVTSAIPGEGKSTIAGNLAIAFSIAGAKTLLVDADLRRGALHSRFNVSGAVGLSEVLQQTVPWQEAVTPTAWNHLSLLPRGNPLQQPGEYLLSPTANRFLQEIRDEYEYVIIDSAPILVAEDTSGIVSRVDAIAVVLRFVVSSVRLSHRAIARIKERQGNVVGVVLNEISAAIPEYSYYYDAEEPLELPAAGGRREAKG